MMILHHYAKWCLWLLLLVALLVPAPGQAANLSFTWNPGVGGAPPTGYIFEQRQGTGAYAEIGRPAAPPTTVTVTTATSPICWQVRAYNAVFTSPPSNEVCLTTPSAPLNMSVIVTGQLAAAPKVQTTIRKRAASTRRGGTLP
jgi:hypothetical protein